MGHVTAVLIIGRKPEISIIKPQTHAIVIVIIFVVVVPIEREDEGYRK